MIKWHKRFLAMLPKIRKHAAVAFRYLRSEAREEAVHEVVCNALKAFVRLVQLKKVDLAYPTVLARYGVKQTRDGRKVGGHLNVKDVLSKYCQDQKDVVVERLDHFDKTEEAWQEVLVEDKHSGPAAVAAMKIDFTEWLKTLSYRVRRIAKLLATGEKTSIVAKKFDLSDGRISQLRRELAQSWKTFQGDFDSTAA
jgi:hypothetical protein